MSGLCGWFAARDGLTPGLPATLLADMADALPGVTASAEHGMSSAAAVNGTATLYRLDGAIVALCGLPLLDGAPVRAGELLRLWRAQGPQACASLSGPFALAILDEASGEALLAIDRSGIHSLHYSYTDALFFASSADALRAHPALHGKLDSQALHDYLYFHMVPAPATIYQGQQRLLPGEYVYFRAGRLRRGSYWRLAFDETANAGASFAGLKSEFLRILQASVRRSAVIGEGGRAGAFLSGGTDSSTLAGVLGQVSGQPATTYSIGFDAPGYDEMAYARIAARHFGTDHHEYYLTPDDVVSAVPLIAAAFDQPFGNASALPAYYCARMAQADGVTRLLGGDGGDELFGGNERYARQAVFERYGKLPAMLRQAVLEPLLFQLAAGSRMGLLCKARSYIEQASVPLPARLETYNLLQRYGHGTVFEASFLDSIETGAPLASLNRAYWRSDGDSQINRLLALDMKFTLADNDLPKVMTACQLAGVDAVFPFLDDEMVAFAARLAPGQKLRGTRLRHFFKQALRDTLPRAILRKQKHGFGLPFGLWLQQHAGLRSLAFDSLSALKQRHIVRASFIDDLQQRHVAEHPAYHGTMVWVLMMLEQWLHQHQHQPSRPCQPQAAPQTTMQRETVAPL